MDLIQRAWRKSSYSGANSGNCIEVASAARNVAVRDSKDPNGPTLAFRPADWEAFTRRIANGTVER